MHETGEYNEVDLSLVTESDEIALEEVLPSENARQKTAESKLLSTDEILHKVVEAAENNQAIEKLLELRHELKDQPKQQPAAASRIGDLLALQHQAAEVKARSAARPVKQGRLHLLTDNSLYGHAVRYGFMSAVLALLLAVLLVLSLR